MPQKRYHSLSLSAILNGFEPPLNGLNCSLNCNFSLLDFKLAHLSVLSTLLLSSSLVIARVAS